MADQLQKQDIRTFYSCWGDSVSGTVLICFKILYENNQAVKAYIKLTLPDEVEQ